MRTVPIPRSDHRVASLPLSARRPASPISGLPALVLVCVFGCTVGLPGQALNRPEASLVINGANGAPPNVVFLAGGQALVFVVGGNPGLPYILLRGPLAVGTLSFGGEQLDLGPLPQVQVLLDGTQPGFLNSLANTGAGSTALAFVLPPNQATGSLQAFQAAVVDPSLPLGFGVSAATEVQVRREVVEEFSDTAQRDTGFIPQFHAAEWNSAGQPGALATPPITGFATASFAGNPAMLGSRTQVTLPFPGPLSTIPSGLFSPFDTASSNLGLPNPNGGSHIMHLFEASDLGNPRDSLELVEWGPVGNLVIGSSYPQYRAWCGMTTITAPISCGIGNGLSSVYRANYNVPTPQPFDPANSSIIAPGTGGVIVSAPQTYTVNPALTSYYPFPVFSPPFDYLGVGPGSANLILEQNIEPGAQLANFNRYRAISNTPVRRLIGGPMSTGQTNSAAAGCDVYDMRFTFVGVASSARSNFYDTGTVSPTYDVLNLLPPPTAQPPGTESHWEFQAATAITGQGAPTGMATNWMTYFQGRPATGVFNPGTLAAMNGHRFFRFRVRLRADNLTNDAQRYERLQMLLQ